MNTLSETRLNDGYVPSASNAKMSLSMQAKKPPTYIKILEILEPGKRYSKHDIVRILGCHERTAQYTLREINRDGLCTLVDWVKSDKLWLPVYELGKGENKPKPARQRGRILWFERRKHERHLRRSRELAGKQIHNLIVIPRKRNDPR